jgi:hypothetical protein
LEPLTSRRIRHCWKRVDAENLNTVVEPDNYAGVRRAVPQWMSTIVVKSRRRAAIARA